MALILLVEDDRYITAALVRALGDAGHVVRPVGQAGAALKILTEDQPDLVILDLGLPDIDGADALRMMRQVSAVPVIVATARRSEQNIITLLEAGADDYVTKPFSAGHILARISAVLRRARTAPEATPSVITVGGLEISPRQRQVILDGAPLQLTRREFDVLTYLAERVGEVVSRRELLAEVWDQARVGEEQTIDVHISWLRRKLGETAAAPRYLHTVRGVGVMMVVPK
ncbi:response regulator transcription factor [Actinoplanes sp. NBRC 103695]|jgi:DNA-binding response OmpR family regulator|uniref:response regulator transcription factor n=1 Tax=Actinoplanes sp. NBRC 103695 TaxID=3032202 RepID=UPI0024A0B641|nr:response regulator transcription factor [Actinoplanes sp. NBRC 103695]GLY97837.1 DNA-binding response regulator [Actinoplanes sp. NBRC 103695]